MNESKPENNEVPESTSEEPGMQSTEQTIPNVEAEATKERALNPATPKKAEPSAEPVDHFELQRRLFFGK